MSYVDGCVIAVPIENKLKFIDHANWIDSIFKELGAIRILECWGDDLPDGVLTDFRKAVKASSDEAVVFSWIEWPEKQTRDDAMEQLHEMMETDQQFDPEKNPVPFDGSRMIYGGFQTIVEV